MDWSKAKKILIYIFIFLNIFLAINIISLTSKNKVSKQVIADTLRVLENSGVQMKCAIPDYAEDTGIPVYKLLQLDKVKIIYNLTGKSVNVKDIENGTPVNTGNGEITFYNDSCFSFKRVSKEVNKETISVNDAEKTIKEIFEKSGFSVSAFQLDKSSVNDDGTVEIKLVGTYNKIIIFDSYIKARVAKNVILDMECSLKAVDSIKEPKKIINAYQILLKNFNVKDTIITRIDFGFKNYKIDPGVQGSDIPAWRIITEDGSERYFKAYNGEEIN